MNLKRVSIWTGEPYPLGASWDGEGVNFAVFSEHAQRIDLCLFDETGTVELAQIPLPSKSDHVWYGYIKGLAPGALYGFRVHGPYEPWHGHRFNHHKLLLDPYAKALSGDFLWDDAHFGYTIGHPDADLSYDTRDNASFLPKCLVVDSSFDWEGDEALRIPWADTIIYEVNVRGFTKLHPDVPESLRGTYAGLASAPALRHLKQLGVTAVELMPVHSFLDERNLVDKGLRNYWGYNSIGFFAPENRYASPGGDAATEFKSMVKRLHAAGIEVILDVVYNHTAEGNHFGPTLSLKGIDNASYYRLVLENPRYYMDYTGCGNTLNVMNPRTLKLIMDSLRYWVLEMHVDGFRFDLAAALARESHGVDRLGAFFDIIHQDPVLSRVKLIAEPWDLGEGGYQLGNFPAGWTEWNGQYRDTLRGFWRGDECLVDKLSRRLTGSSDLYQHSGRSPCASINFITSHDGFTLEDLVTYNHKHNDQNLDNNMDGDNNNLSWNCGWEGPSEDLEIQQLRGRQKRNMLASLLLSHGVPMITAGDELGNTQHGNNNGYCQDNEISWLNWNLSVDDQNHLEFVQELIALRKKHPVFRRESFANCLNPEAGNPMCWLKPSGELMLAEDWCKHYTRCLGLVLCGNNLQQFTDKRRRMKDSSFFMLLNAHWEPIRFSFPAPPLGGVWRLVFDTSRDRRDLRKVIVRQGRGYRLGPRSFALFVEDRPRASVRDLKPRKVVEPPLPPMFSRPDGVPVTVYGLYPTS